MRLVVNVPPPNAQASTPQPKEVFTAKPLRIIYIRSYFNGNKVKIITLIR